MLGSVAFDIPDWSYFIPGDVQRFVDTVISDSIAISTGRFAVYQRAGANVSLDRFTAATFGSYGYALSADPTEPKHPDFAVGASITSSMFHDGPTAFTAGATPYLASFTHGHNDLFDVPIANDGISTDDPSDFLSDPGFDTATYGRGAYLIRSSVGVGGEVLHRYVDGVLTADPLLPWPMEARIARELGVSVTWESGGGLWRTTPPVAGCKP